MKNLSRHIYRKIRAQILQRIIPQSGMALPEQDSRSTAGLRIEVIGFFHSISGIGESARLCAQQLAEDGYSVNCTSVEAFFHKPAELDWQWHNSIAQNEINCRIYHLNPPMLPPVILQMGINQFKRTFNIGYWAWELEAIPDEWIKATHYMNAIMTPSQFTTNTIQRYTQLPVLTVTHPVAPEQPASDIRKRLHIPDNAFVVANIFSFGSAMERKNPLGLIAAFTQAFADNPNTYLILKANAGENSQEKKTLLAAIAGHSNILLLDQHWSKSDILGLIATADLYASLHRSEGFGLTIAEAMLLNTPTLVTGWSGNMDFCTQENSFLVGYAPIKVNSSHPEFSEFDNATWADANIQEAANLLRTIYENPSELTHKKQCCGLHMKHTINNHKYEHALKQLALRKP
ncbi:glycosyltransferase family 4 protein [Cellvibrio sp. OA-2007]|uniref:glycosyltransferase family 4 protein n=1 Tax=Cellvibrio sp. OA-2007 TaxID=529823 RepID=UPI00078189FA|nr:glycosyltransferase family 4 protein [Cellvibrio sp. OA-2007]